MGREVQCDARIGEDIFHVKATLEEGMIHLRGETRLDIPTGGLRVIEAQFDALQTVLDDGRTLELQLGAKEAALWFKKITNPPSRLDKLGIKMGSRVALAGLDMPGFDHELQSGGASTSPVAEADIVLIGVDDLEELNSLQRIASTMPRFAHLWVLRPRGAAQGISESAVMQHGKTLGLQLSKTLRFSERYTGERFTWPKS